MGWADAPLVEEGNQPKWMSAPTVDESAVPADVRARWAAAKAGTLEASPESLARHEAANAQQPEGESFLRRLDRKVGSAIEAVNRPLSAFNHGFTNMYMLGGLDEVQGAADAVLTGKSFGEARQAAKAQLDAESESYPITSTVAGLAGAVASPAAQLAMKYFPAGASLRSQVGAGAASGAALGAAQGFMEGEAGAADRFRNMLSGGALGGAVGGAVPALSSAIGSTWRGARNALADWRATGQIADDLGISRSGGRVLSQTLGMDDPVRMRAALASAGDDAMLADAGPTALRALDGAVTAPGEAARTAFNRIDERAAAAGSRLSGELDSSLTGNNIGSPSSRQFSNTASLQGDIRASTAPARKAMYDAAYARPIDYGSAQGSALLDDISPRLPADAINYANKLMRMNGEKSAQIMASVADDGTVAFTNPPDVRQWDYIKQALDGLAESGDGAGALGGQTRMGAAYQGLARDIRRNLGEAVPEYDYAVNAAGDIIGQVKAIKTGETMLRASMTRGEVETMLDGMSQAELGAVKRGLRQSIDDQLANVRAIMTDPNIDAREAAKSYAMLTSRASQDKMKMLLGEDWEPVKKALDETASSLRVRSAVGGNSATIQRKEFLDMINEAVEPGMARKGSPVGSARSIWQGITRASPSAVAGANARVRNELADVLTRPQAMNLLAGVEAARAAHPIIATAGQGVTNALNALGLPLAPTLGNELRNLLAPQ